MIIKPKLRLQPRYNTGTHSCPDCKFIGQYKNWDLYHCTGEHPQLSFYRIDGVFSIIWAIDDQLEYWHTKIEQVKELDKRKWPQFYAALNIIKPLDNPE